MEQIGVIHGRFQIVHNDHLTYLLAGKSRCEHLVVGITNPDPTLTRSDPSNPERSTSAANPLTYFERYVLLNTTLLDAGVPHTFFSVVPFPINFPDLFRYYVPLDAVFYVTIYDAWGHRKRRLLESLGLRVEVMWEKPPEEKGIAASEVRNRMVKGLPWEDLVPAGAVSLLKSWGIPERIAMLPGVSGTP